MKGPLTWNTLTTSRPGDPWGQRLLKDTPPCTGTALHEHPRTAAPPQSLCVWSQSPPSIFSPCTCFYWTRLASHQVLQRISWEEKPSKGPPTRHGHRVQWPPPCPQLCFVKCRNWEPQGHGPRNEGRRRPACPQVGVQPAAEPVTCPPSFSANVYRARILITNGTRSGCPHRTTISLR